MTGYQNGDTSAVLTGSATGSSTATATTGVGGYTISGATGSLGVNDGNYTFAAANGTLTINKAHLTVTVPITKSMSYARGSSASALTDTITGYNEQRAGSGVLSGSPTLSTTATAYNGTAGSGSNAGTYTITARNGTLYAANYDFTPVNGTLTVNKARIFTVTADNQSMSYGAGSLPSLTDTITGYLNSENATSAGITGTPTLSTTATAYNGTAGSGSNAGNYTITAAAGTLAAANYDFAYVNGTLTVNKAVLTATADAQTRLYGQSNPTFTETVSGYQNGDTASILTGSATGSSAATMTTGVGTAIITGSNGTLGVNDGNYTFAAAQNGTLTINKAHLTVTADGG